LTIAQLVCAEYSQMLTCSVTLHTDLGAYEQALRDRRHMLAKRFPPARFFCEPSCVWFNTDDFVGDASDLLFMLSLMPALRFSTLLKACAARARARHPERVFDFDEESAPRPERDDDSGEQSSSHGARGRSQQH